MSFSYQSWLQSNEVYLAAQGMSMSNMSFLKQEIPEEISIYQTKTDTLSIKYRNTSLHSTYDPEKEAKRFIDSQNVRAGDYVLVYGLGLGYHIKYLRDIVGFAGKIIIFEPNGAIFNAAMILIDFRTIFSADNMTMIIGDNEEMLTVKLSSFITREFADVPGEQKKIIIHLPSYQCLSPEYTTIQEVFDLMLLERKAAQVFGNVEKENFIHNLPSLIRSPSLQGLRKTCQGKPALFINAGPSLDRSIQYLKQYNKKAFIFTSDTSYAFLKKVGIDVDVVFSVDPQTETRKHFIGKHDTDALLITLPTVNWHSFDAYPGHKMCVMQKDNTVTKDLESYFQDKTFTEAGGSVSCIGLDLLLQLGCDPVIMTGMDYAFPCYKFYSSNTVEMKKWHTHATRFHTLEMMHYNVVQEQKIKKVRNSKGHLIPTHETMYLYLRQIEGIMGRYLDVDFYNFRSLGACIKGSQDIDMVAELNKLLHDEIDKEFTHFTYCDANAALQQAVLASFGG